ncbi:MAG: hypothetical protein JJT89_13695, partial [Nitriliruptoraceae bacterium]|nr:hypothetical protein [Nitriliruptoraceae bacterium]
MNEALVLLVLLWAGFLVPSALRNRHSSPHATVGGFERAMDVLGSGPQEVHMSRSSSGRRLMVPGDANRIVERESAGAASADMVSVHVRGRDPVVARREAWFVRSLIATGASFLAAVLVGGYLWTLFAVVFLVSLGYVAVLRHLKLQRDEARRVVAELDLHRQSTVIDVTDRATQPTAAAVGASEPWAGSTTVPLAPRDASRLPAAGSAARAPPGAAAAGDD